MKNKNCFICFSAENQSIYSLFRNNKRVILKLCLSCGFVFQEHQSRSDYLDYYESKYRDIKPRNIDGIEHQKLKKMESLWNIICSKYDDLSNPCKVLDIGCAKGYFLDILLKKRYSTYGIEPDRNDALVATNKNHNVMQGLFNINSFQNQKFDIITAFNVLEHVLEPKKFVNNIHEKLNEGGYFIVNVPCLDYLPIHNGKASLFHDGHVNFFSINVLSAFLENQNFKVIKKISGEEYNQIYRPKKEKAYCCLVCKKHSMEKGNDLINFNFVSESKGFFIDHMNNISFKEKIKQVIPYSWEVYFFLKSQIISILKNSRK